VAVTLVVVT